MSLHPPPTAGPSLLGWSTYPTQTLRAHEMTNGLNKLDAGREKHPLHRFPFLAVAKLTFCHRCFNHVEKSKLSFSLPFPIVSYTQTHTHIYTQIPPSFPPHIHTHTYKMPDIPPAHFTQSPDHWDDLYAFIMSRRTQNAAGHFSRFRASLDTFIANGSDEQK